MLKKYISRFRKALTKCLKWFTATKAIVFALVFLSLTVVILASRLDLKIKPAKKPPFTNNIQVRTPDPLCSIPYNDPSIYTISPTEVSIKDITNFRELSFKRQTYTVPVSSKIVNFSGYSYSPKLNKIAYIDSFEDEKNKETDIIYLHDVKTGQKEKLYEMNVEKIDSRGEYEKRITGVSFSHDSSKLAVTTGESLVIYDLGTKTSETIFDEDRDAMSFGVFSYTIPYSWPNNNKILLWEGYYEGRGASLYDLSTKQKISLNYMVYYMGESVLGIIENELIVSKVVVNSTEKFEDFKSEIYAVDINTLEEKLLTTVKGSVFEGKVSANGKIYLIQETHYENDAYYCHNGKSSGKQNTYVYSIIKLDPKTKAVTELLKVDKKSYTIKNMYVNSGENGNDLLLQLDQGYFPKRFLLNENSPYNLTHIN